MLKILKYLILSLLFATIVYWLIFAPKALSETAQEVLEPVQVINTKTLSVKEQIQYTFGNKWELAYAVMMSEGEGDPKAKNYNTDPRKTHDRGLYQINSYWHSEVSDKCAYDIQCSTKEAYRISKGGTNWNPWYGYTNGNYLKHLQ
jgi:hypothetical protein